VCTAAMPFWLVGLPPGKAKRKEAAWELLQEHTQHLSVNAKVDLPELRVGTLDTLMALRCGAPSVWTSSERGVAALRRRVGLRLVRVAICTRRSWPAASPRAVMTWPRAAP
jgi:hypothetical protein